MKLKPISCLAAMFIAILLLTIGYKAAFSQDQAAADQKAQEVPLTDEEIQTLVARIALYPDELVAVIVAGATYPLQIVQAARFLEDKKTKKDLEPDESWDGS